MALQTFAPPVPPSEPLPRPVTATVIETPFGDGYKQRAADGLNSMSEVLRLSWVRLSRANADMIEDFLRDHAGSKPFLYRPPGAAAPKQWVCKGWEPTDLRAGKVNLTATFEQDFSL